MNMKCKTRNIIFLTLILFITSTLSVSALDTWIPFDLSNPWPSQDTNHRVSHHSGITDPYEVSSYTVSGGHIASPVVLSNDETSYYFYFYKNSDATTYLNRVSKSGYLEWSIAIGDVRGGAPIVIDAKNYDNTKTDLILTQKYDGITTFFDDGSQHKTTDQKPTLDKMSGNFMAVGKNNWVVFSSQHTAMRDTSGTLSTKYYINRMNIEYMKSVSSEQLAEGLSTSSINDSLSESSITTDKDGYSYGVIGGNLVIYDENFNRKLFYSNNALQTLYASNITVGPSNTLFIASYAQSSQGDFVSPRGSVLKLQLSSDKTQVISAVEITDNGDLSSNTPYVHSQIAVDNDGNAYYTTGMSIYENKVYQGQKTGRLLKLDTNNTVTTLYTCQSGESLFQPPTLTDDGIIYLPNGVVLDSTGTLLWSKPCYYSAAVDNNGHVYFATSNSVTIYKQREGGYPSFGGDMHISEGNPPDNLLTTKTDSSIVVRRYGNTEGTITVDYKAEDITAISGEDYLPTSGTLTFGDNDTVAHIPFTYYNDRVHKGDRQLKLVLENPTGCSGMPDNIMESIITIHEDDSQDTTPPYMISSDPTNNQTNLIPIDKIRVDFNEYIVSEDGLNNITLSDGEHNISITPTLGLKDINISINTILKMSTDYTLTIPSNTISDPSGNRLNDDIIISFSTLDAQFSGGDGTPANPYIIDSPRALYSVKDFPNKCYIVTQDIDMGPSTSLGGDYYFDGKGWSPIPNFTGILDGQGYKISNMNINRKDDMMNMGVFSTNSGTIMNLSVNNSAITYENNRINSSHVGLVAGYNTGLIYNCSNDQSVLIFKQTSQMTNYVNGYYIGGIVGTNKGTISNCTNTAVLQDESKYTTYVCSIGGIAGFNDTGTVKMCYNDAEIHYPSTLQINNNVHPGGIVGRNQGDIFDCYNNKNIEDGYSIVAMNTSEHYANAKVERCYSVSDNTSLNRLSGPYVSIDHIYQFKGGNNVYTSLYDWGGMPHIGHTAVYDSLDTMKQQESYLGFDFDGVWKIVEDNSFPTLRDVKSVQSLTVGTNNVPLKTNQTHSISAEVFPVDATVGDVCYLSNDSDVASVSAGGIITATGPGSTKVYAYTREGLHTQTINVIVTNCIVSLNSNNGDSLVQISTGYNTNIATPQKPTYNGYHFDGWFDANGNLWDFENNIVTEDIILTAKWTARDDVVYTVNHYKQNLEDDGYTLAFTETLSGNTGESVTASAISYTGFTENITHSSRVSFGVVEANGSLVLSLYYDRNLFDVTFNSNGASSIASQTNIKYGGAIIEPNNPSKPSYSFGGWYKDASLTELWDFTSEAVTQDITLYAKWIQNPPLHDGGGGKSSKSIDDAVTIKESVKGENKTVSIKQKDVEITFNGLAFKALKNKIVQVKIEKIDKNDLDVPNDVKEQIEDLPIYDISILVDGKKTHFESNEPIVIKIPVEEDYEGHKIVAVYIDNNGNTELMKGVVIDRVMSFTTNHLSSYALMYIDKTFDDIATHWGKRAVETLASREVINGKTETTFGPVDTITRTEFVALMVRYFDLTSNNTENYSDVMADTWYTDSIAIAKANGILPTIYGDIFEPAKEITREEMMYILHKSLDVTKKLDRLEDMGDKLYDFEDMNSISDYAYEGVQYLVSRDIINGSDNRLNPKDTSTRAEVAQMLYNLLLIEYK